MDTFDIINVRKSYMLIALTIVKGNVPHPKRLTLEQWKIDTVRTVHSFSHMCKIDSDFVSDKRFECYVKELVLLGHINTTKDTYALNELGMKYVHSRYISRGIYMKERTESEDDDVRI